MTTGIAQRLPDRAALLAVYSVAAVPIFGWTLTVGFWKLPSWLNYLTPLEIASIFCYAMLAALVESLVIFGVLVLLCLVLPARLLRDCFTVRGTWLAIGLTLAVLGNGLWRGLTRFTYVEISLILWSLLSLLFILMLAVVSTRIRFMGQLANGLSDRLTVFLYLLIPLCLVAGLVVAARNLL